MVQVEVHAGRAEDEVQQVLTSFEVRCDDRLADYQAGAQEQENNAKHLGKASFRLNILHSLLPSREAFLSAIGNLRRRPARDGLLARASWGRVGHPLSAGFIVGGGRDGAPRARTERVWQFDRKWGVRSADLFGAK